MSPVEAPVVPPASEDKYEDAVSELPETSFSVQVTVFVVFCLETLNLVVCREGDKAPLPSYEIICLSAVTAITLAGAPSEPTLDLDRLNTLSTVTPEYVPDPVARIVIVATSSPESNPPLTVYTLPA